MMVLDIRFLKDAGELSIKEIAELTYPAPMQFQRMEPHAFFLYHAIENIPKDLMDYDQLIEEKQKRTIDDEFLIKNKTFLKSNKEDMPLLRNIPQSIPEQNKITFTRINQKIYYELLDSNSKLIQDSINFAFDEEPKDMGTFLMETAVTRGQIQPEPENATPDYVAKRYKLEQKLILACQNGHLKYYGPLKEIRYLSWEEYGIKHIEFTGDPEAGLLENIEPYSRITAIFCDVDTNNMNNKERWSGKSNPKYKQIYKKIPNQCLIQQKELKYFSAVPQNQWFREEIKNARIEEWFSDSEIIEPTPLDFNGVKNKWWQEYHIVITNRTILPLLRKGYFGAYVVIDKIRQKTENIQTYIEDKIAKSLWDKAVSEAIKNLLESNNHALEDFLLHFEEYRESLFKASLEPLIDKCHLHLYSSTANYSDIREWEVYLDEYRRMYVIRGQDGRIKEISGLPKEIDLNNLSQRLEDPILKMQILVYLAQTRLFPSKVTFADMLKRFPQILEVFKEKFLEQSNPVGLENFMNLCENRSGELKDTIVNCKGNLPALEAWIERAGKEIVFYELCLDKLTAFIEKYPYLLKKYDNYERLPISEEADILPLCKSWSIDNIINKESPFPSCTCGLFIDAGKEIFANSYTNQYPPLAAEKLFIEQCHSCENLYFFSDQLQRFERTAEFKELVSQLGGNILYTDMISKEKMNKEQISYLTTVLDDTASGLDDKISKKLSAILMKEMSDPRIDNKKLWINVKQNMRAYGIIQMDEWGRGTKPTILFADDEEPIELKTFQNVASAIRRQKKCLESQSSGD